MGIGGAGIVALGIAGVVLGRLPGAGLVVVAFSGGGLLLIARVAAGTFPALADRRVNWLMKRTPNGLVLKFRSHLNAHLPAEDVVAARIGYDEIEWLRRTRERRLVTDSDGNGPAVTFKTFLDIKLRTDDAERLAECVRAERAREAPWVKHWYGRSRTRHRHHPVRMAAPDRVRVSWEASPGLAQVLASLRHMVTVAPDARGQADFHHLEELSRREQEARIRTLAEEGDLFTAIRTAKLAFGLSTSDAMKRVRAITTAESTEAESPSDTPAALP
jgi:hypothetical protein